MEKNIAKKIRIKKALVLSVLVGILLIIIGMVVWITRVISKAPDVSEVSMARSGKLTSFVYDESGEVIASFSDGATEDYIGIEELPKEVIQAVIAIEDETYYEHHGIDMKKSLGALLSNITSSSWSEGGTTITQQVIKNAALLEGNSFDKKIQEMYLAFEFEKLYSKDTILEYYLNTMNFGGGTQGIEAAAKRYFGKSAVDLNLVEGAVLIAMIERPTYYDPMIHPDYNWKGVIQILEKMEKLGYIDETIKTNALKQMPYEEIEKVQKEQVVTIEEFNKGENSDFKEVLYRQVVADLQTTYGISEVEAKAKIYGEGLQIQSTLDSKLQGIVEKYMSDKANYPEKLHKVQVDYEIKGKKVDGEMFEHQAYGVILNSEEEVDAFKEKQLLEWGVPSDAKVEHEKLLVTPQPQSAFVLSDYRTGAVKALYGGRSKETYYSQNYATTVKRQPGSTLKILSVYAPALNEGLITPDTVINNEQVTYLLENGESWSPKNWDGVYGGTYTVSQAIANSMNVITARILVDQLGVEKSYDYLEQFGLTTIGEEDKTYALGLGGLTKGIIPLELNAAYSTIANEGTYVAPSFYTVVKDAEGKVILDRTQGNFLSTHEVLKKEVAKELTQMLCEVVDGPSAHTAGKVRKYFKDMPIAGKSGISSGNKDLLFVGYTPYYAATIWTGYTAPDVMNDNENYQLVLWGKIMDEIHQGLAYKPFQ